MTSKVTYIVSGFMRTGTSMMMKALNAGGLEAVFSTEKDDLINQAVNRMKYDPNPGGYFELLKDIVEEKYFPRQFEGKLIKVMGSAIKELDTMAGGYRIVFMMRHPEEIYLSHKAMDYDVPNDFFTRYEYQMGWNLRNLQNRRDVLSIACFDYSMVIENPLAHFQHLEKEGWPIDPEKAAAVVDPALYRNKVGERAKPLDRK